MVTPWLIKELICKPVRVLLGPRLVGLDVQISSSAPGTQPTALDVQIGSKNALDGAGAGGAHIYPCHGTAPEQLVLLAVSSGSQLGSAPLLEKLRAATSSATLGGSAPAEQLAGPGAPDAGMQQILAFQAERIVQLEVDERKLAEEVESLRRSAAAQPVRVAEGVPPVVAAAAAAELSAVDPEAAALASRGRQQIDDLRDLLQKSLAQLERPVRHLPSAAQQPPQLDIRGVCDRPGRGGAGLS